MVFRALMIYGFMLTFFGGGVFAMESLPLDGQEEKTVPSSKKLTLRENESSLEEGEALNRNFELVWEQTSEEVNLWKEQSPLYRGLSLNPIQQRTVRKVLWGDKPMLLQAAKMWHELPQDTQFQLFWRVPGDRQEILWEAPCAKPIEFWDFLAAPLLKRYSPKSILTAEEQREILRLSYIKCPIGWIESCARNGDDFRHALSVIGRNLETVDAVYTQTILAQGEWNEIKCYFYYVDIHTLTPFLYKLQFWGDERKLYTNSYFMVLKRLFFEETVVPDQDVKKLHAFIYGLDINDLKLRLRFLRRIAYLYDLLDYKDDERSVSEEIQPSPHLPFVTKKVYKRPILQEIGIWDASHPILRALIDTKDGANLSGCPEELRTHAERMIKRLPLEERTISKALSIFGMYKGIEANRVKFVTQVQGTVPETIQMMQLIKETKSWSALFNVFFYNQSFSSPKDLENALRREEK
jgi:hypothetical protein